MMHVVQAVEQKHLSDEWDEPSPELPMDQSSLVTTAMPLASLVLALLVVLARSLP